MAAVTLVHLLPEDRGGVTNYKHVQGIVPREQGDRVYQDVGIAKARNGIFVCIADKLQTECIAHSSLQTHRLGQNHEPGSRGQGDSQ